MKKVFLFLSAISFVAISSCSDDDTNPANPPVDPGSDVLVKRMVTQQNDPEGFNYTVDYTYDGNKLVQGIWDDGTIEKYYYTGDLITKVEYIVAGEVEDRELYTYNAQGKLAEMRIQYLVDDFEDKSIFVYNSDNTITETNIIGDIGNTTTTGEEMTITLQNGEISQIVHTGGATYTYTHDNKNSPFKNVTGYAEIAYIIQGDYEFNGRGRNIESIVNESASQNYIINTWQYNADNYPVAVSSTAIFESDSPNQTETITRTYTYQ